MVNSLDLQPTKLTSPLTLIWHKMMSKLTQKVMPMSPNRSCLWKSFPGPGEGVEIPSGLQELFV